MSILANRALILAVLTTNAGRAMAQSTPSAAFTTAGEGNETYVLISGMVGGVAGFQRLERLLLARGHRVIVIDPYRLSLDSADVTFAAMARRVDAILAAEGVVGALVVAHSQGAGVALRLAATSPGRAAALYLLDAGAQAANHGPTLSVAVRLVPVLTRMPGGRGFVRTRFIRALHESSGHQEWLDTATVRAYTDPMLDGVDRVVAMACRLAHAEEPEALAVVVSRIHIPVTVLIGDAPHETGAGPEELSALRPLGTLLRVEHEPGVGHFIHEEVPNEVARVLFDRRGSAVEQHLARAGEP